MTYIIETLGADGRVTHSDTAAELPDGLTLTEPWSPMLYGGEVAYGTAPAYLGDQPAGRCRVRIIR